MPLVEAERQGGPSRDKPHAACVIAHPQTRHASMGCDASWRGLQNGRNLLQLTQTARSDCLALVSTPLLNSGVTLAMIFRFDSRAVMFASLLASCAPAALAFGAISIAVSSAQALTQDVTLENIKIDLPPRAMAPRAW